MFWYSFRILPDRLKLIRLYPCGSLKQSISFIFRAWVGHFAVTPQSDIVGIWSRDLGVMAALSVWQKMPFFSCIYNPQITISPTSSFSASFNGNRVKNHPKPWTCPLSFHLAQQSFFIWTGVVPRVREGVYAERHGDSCCGRVPSKKQRWLSWKLSFDWQPVECFELWSNMFMSALAKRNFQCKVLITASISEQRFTVVQPTENKRMHQLSSGFHH